MDIFFIAIVITTFNSPEWLNFLSNVINDQRFNFLYNCSFPLSIKFNGHCFFDVALVSVECLVALAIFFSTLYFLNSPSYTVYTANVSSVYNLSFLSKQRPLQTLLQDNLLGTKVRINFF